ncbi:hypothetical protein AVEN_98707-1, partial [Araneus ventricosus]
PNSSCIKFFGLLSHAQQDFVLNVVTISSSSSSSDENCLGVSLGCSTDQPDLAPCDFDLSGPLKQHLGGKHFTDDDYVDCKVFANWLL